MSDERRLDGGLRLLDRLIIAPTGKNGVAIVFYYPSCRHVEKLAVVQGEGLAQVVLPQ